MEINITPEQIKQIDAVLLEETESDKLAGLTVDHVKKACKVTKPTGEKLFERYRLVKLLEAYNALFADHEEASSGIPNPTDPTPEDYRYQISNGDDGFIKLDIQEYFTDRKLVRFLAPEV